MNKFTKFSLPVTSEFLRQKRLVQDRGELALIEDGMVFRHLGFFSLIPGKDFFRGGHYHKIKTERFYIVAGRLRVHLVDIDSEEKFTIDVSGGDSLTLKPMCAHRFSALEYAHVIEYYENVYDSGDDYRWEYEVLIS